MAAENAIGLTYDDLLAAISPRRTISNAELQRAIAAVVAVQQDGQITAQEAAAIIKVMFAMAMSGQVNAIVNDFFTPGARGPLGDGGFGQPAIGPRNHRISLF